MATRFAEMTTTMPDGAAGFLEEVIASPVLVNDDEHPVLSLADDPSLVPLARFMANIVSHRDCRFIVQAYDQCGTADLSPDELDHLLDAYRVDLGLDSVERLVLNTPFVCN